LQRLSLAEWNQYLATIAGQITHPITPTITFSPQFSLEK